MRCVSLFPVFALSLICVNLNAQDVKPTKPTKFKIASFSGYYSASDEKLPAGSLDDFRKLAPNLELLENDFSSFDARSTSKVFSKMYGGYAGFEFNKKEKNAFRKNSFLNLGLNYSESINLLRNYYLTRYDDANPSDQDTTFFETYTMKNDSKKVFLDLSLRYKIIPDKRFSFYSGIGLCVGMLYYNKTQISNSSSMYFTGISQDTTQANNFSSTQVNYGFRNKQGYALSTYIPVGLDFRVGKNDNFLRMIHLFIEARPSVKVVFLHEIEPKFSAFLNYGLGVKFTRE